MRLLQGTTAAALTSGALMVLVLVAPAGAWAQLTLQDLDVLNFATAIDYEEDGFICGAGSCNSSELFSSTVSVPVGVTNSVSVSAGPSGFILSGSCSATGASNAPIFADAEAWAPRIAKGTDELISTTINGLGLMPPKGACMDCSDEDLRAAVDYMTSSVK